MMSEEEPENTGHEDGPLTSLWYGIRRIYIPTSPSLMLESQKAVFNRLVKTNVAHKRFHLQSGEYMNYVDIKGEGKAGEGAENTEAPTLLLAHGFASGCGFFFSNYDAFSTQFSRVVSVDWLGMGGSSRPSSAPKLPLFGAPAPPSEVANFFVDSLEELRKGLGITNFVLAGHSLGGYLVGRYALKYTSPDLKGLVLISPAGLAPHPPQERIVPTDSLGFRIRMLGRAWDRNFTPQVFARTLGHFAPKYVRQAVDRRFGADRFPPEDMQAIADYLYHISALPASGEYALNTLLTAYFVSSAENPEVQRPRVLAREPIAPEHFACLRSPIGSSKDQAIDLTAGSVSEADPSSGGIPLLILYGDNDWLCFPEVKSYVESLRNHGLDARLSIIRGAGHHLYMDNPDQYHDEIHDWLRDRVLKYGGRS